MRLASALNEISIKRNKIELVGTLEEAQNVIEIKKPKIAFCEFEVGRQSSLDLIQKIRESNKTSASDLLQNSLFILITNNTSQSAVARAAEEDVDSFILKPYTTDSLKKSVLATVKGIIAPTPYMLTIEKGKHHLNQGQFQEAKSIFDDAVKLDPSPTLALYYLGQTKEMLKALEAACISFSKGLDLNKIHYKCLVGMYELLMKQNKPVEAYSVVRRLAQYFPANPKRLSSVLRLAIVTENYDDIESYYRTFTNIEQRNKELIAYMCSALIVTAKYYFRIKNIKRAGELLENAAISSAADGGFLRKIVETYVDNEVPSSAKLVLNRFAQGERRSPHFLIAQFYTLSLSEPPAQIVQKGRELLDLNVIDFKCFKILIENSLLAGLKDYAESLFEKASSLWPAQKEELVGIMNSSKQAA